MKRHQGPARFIPTEPPTSSVRDGLSRYLRRNGFSADEYTAKTFSLELFGRKYTFPNPPSRMRAIPLHDLHHVATGYGTDLVGEAEIGAWELVAGCDSLVLYGLNGLAALFGLTLAPRRIIRAALRARGDSTLYKKPTDYDALMNLSVGELRAHLGIPREGQADEPGRLFDGAPVTSDPLEAQA